MRFDWQKQPGRHDVWLYESEDVTACVYAERKGGWSWSVEGPGGRWTKASGFDVVSPDDAKYKAQLWIDGYRRGRKEASE